MKSDKNSDNDNDVSDYEEKVSVVKIVIILLVGSFEYVVVDEVHVINFPKPYRSIPRNREGRRQCIGDANKRKHTE